jgi:hypothetical protein
MGRTCPSGRCREGAVLLGIVGAKGVLGHVSPPIPIDAEFVERARQGGTPEARFRFAEPCIEQECGQWTGCRCGVIDAVVHSSAGQRIAQEAPGPLPVCAIRSSCRWFAQTGPPACVICPYIVHTPEKSSTDTANVA